MCSSLKGFLVGGQFLLFVHANCDAQVINRRVEAGSLFGKTLEIQSNFPETDFHTGAFVSFLRTKNSAASKAFGNPSSGFCLSFHDFGNRSVLGHGLGAQFEISWRQWLSQRVYLTERFRPGLLYASNPFNAATNTKNIVIGSHFSALMGASFGMGFSLGNIELNTEISIWHSSNGHTALPNVGMNAPLAQTSISYNFHRREKDSLIHSARLPNSWQLVSGFSIGLNEAGGTTRPVNTPLYPKYLINSGVAYRFRNIHRVSITLDGYYDQTYWLLNHTQEWDPKNNLLAHSALMLMFGHEFIYQRWGLLISAGVNLYNPTLDRIIGRIELPNTANTIKRYIPGRFAIRYYGFHPWRSEKNVFLQVGIKSNFGQADFLEMGIGFVIAKN